MIALLLGLTSHVKLSNSMINHRLRLLANTRRYLLGILGFISALLIYCASNAIAHVIGKLYFISFIIYILLSWRRGAQGSSHQEEDHQEEDHQEKGHQIEGRLSPEHRAHLRGGFVDNQAHPELTLDLLRPYIPLGRSRMSTDPLGNPLDEIH